MTSLCFFSLPSFFSTVTPGQFPTNWLEPVSALNRVVFTAVRVARKGNS